MQTGRRTDVADEGVLASGDHSRYVRMHPAVMVLYGVAAGTVYVVLFPFIALAVVVVVCAQRMWETIAALAAISRSFHWNPKHALLTGGKKKRQKRKK